MDGFWPTFTRRPKIPARRAYPPGQEIEGYLKSPRRVLIPIRDDTSSQFNLTISEGKKVGPGERIGEKVRGDGKIALRATIAGEFRGIVKAPVPDGFYSECALIERMEDWDVKDQDLREYGLSGEGLLREAGIPFKYDKLKKARVLVLNATQFEPHFGLQNLLLSSNLDELLDGMNLVKEIFGIEHSVICLERKNKDLSEKLKPKLKHSGTIVFETKRAYPRKGKRLLLREVSRNGTLNEDDYVVFSDPWIFVCTSRAVRRGEPYLERPVEVDGSAFPTPRILMVRIGTPFQEIFEFLETKMDVLTEIVVGGVLQGIPQPTLEVPVSYDTGLILAFMSLNLKESTESKIYRESTCVRCAKCVDVCPSNIVPNVIVESLRRKLFERALYAGIERCVECGLCSYVCPSRIPLLTIIKIAKRDMGLVSGD